MRRTVFAVAALLAGSLAGRAAELPPAGPVHVHRAHPVHVMRAHHGYYWGRWGSRTGGSGQLWYRSTFALGGGGWEGGPALLASSPRRVFAVHCNWARPDACLSKPIVVPVGAALADGR